MDIVLAIATVLGGLSAIWFFLDIVRGKRRKKDNNNEVELPQQNTLNSQTVISKLNSVQIDTTKIPISLDIKGHSVEIFVPSDIVIEILLQKLMKDQSISLHKEANSYLEAALEDLDIVKELPNDKTLADLGYPAKNGLNNNDGKQKVHRFRIVFHAKKKCFPLETKVLLPTMCYKTIKNINVGDSISTYDIQGSTIHSSIVVAVFYKKVTSLVQVNNQVSGSSSQTILTTRGWKRFDQLKIGDRIVNYNFKSEFVYEIKKSVGRFKVANLLLDNTHTFITNGFIVEDQIGISAESMLLTLYNTDS